MQNPIINCMIKYYYYYCYNSAMGRINQSISQKVLSSDERGWLASGVSQPKTSGNKCSEKYYNNDDKYDHSYNNNTYALLA